MALSQCLLLKSNNNKKYNKSVINKTSTYPPPTSNTTADTTDRSTCAKGSPVCPIVANFYMEEVESRALNSFKGITSSHWFRYVDNTWIKIKTQEVEAFTEHLNSNTNIKLQGGL